MRRIGSSFCGLRERTTENSRVPRAGVTPSSLPSSQARDPRRRVTATSFFGRWPRAAIGSTRPRPISARRPNRPLHDIRISERGPNSFGTCAFAAAETCPAAAGAFARDEAANRSRSYGALSDSSLICADPTMTCSCPCPCSCPTECSTAACSSWRSTMDWSSRSSTEPGTTGSKRPSVTMTKDWMGSISPCWTSSAASFVRSTCLGARHRP